MEDQAIDLTKSLDPDLAIGEPLINVLGTIPIKYTGGQIEPDCTLTKVPPVLGFVPLEFHQAVYTLPA